MSSTKDLTANKVLLIVGPTAVGKTTLSIELARRLKAEIVSADSRQVYRYMDIGTAKPDSRYLASVAHHFISTRNPDEYYSAGEYGRQARECIAGLLQKGIPSIVVGGSGFYIQALVDGLFAPKISDHEIKEKWRQKIRTEGNQAVFEHLQRIDPESAARLHPNDEQRIVRALEVHELTGKPISSFRQQKANPADFNPVFVGLEMDRQLLYQRIGQRVDRMLADGLVQEVETLREMGYDPHLHALRTVGYQEVFDYLDEKIPFDAMIELIKRNSRRYAKRQMTWFRRDPRIRWLDTSRKTTEEVVEFIISKFDKSFDRENYFARG